MDLLLADVVLSTEEQLVATTSSFVVPREEGLVQSLLIADEADELAEAKEEQEDSAVFSLHC